MTIEIGFTDEQINTQYAPLAALLAHCREHQVLSALDQVQVPMKKRDFTPTDKLKQVLVSILASCATLSEVNSRLKAEHHLARVLDWTRFVDQSNLSRTLDVLTLKQIDNCAAARPTFGDLVVAPRPMTGVATSGWTSIYPVCRVVCGPKKAKKATSVTKKHEWTPVSTRQCHQIPRNCLVRRVCWQLAYQPLPAASRGRSRNCIRVNSRTASAHGLAH